MVSRSFLPASTVELRPPIFNRKVFRNPTLSFPPEKLGLTSWSLLRVTQLRTSTTG